MERKNVSFGLMVILSVLLLLFCTKETVMSRGKANEREKRQYYISMEKEYHANMKQLLEGKGYRNSGITIRWISDGQGTRDYTVMIHHRKIDWLDDKGKTALMQELSGMEFTDEKCTFRYEFIDI